MGTRKGEFNIQSFGEIMKITYISVFVLLVGAGGFGCSNTAEKSSDSTNSNMVTAPRNSPAANWDATDSDVVANQSRGRLRERANRNSRVDVDPSATPVRPTFQQAAEDSEASVTMLQDGSVLEIRVFKSHPQLARVEAISNGDSVKALKIFFKNGEVREVKTDRISNLAAARTSEILEIAGIQAHHQSADRPQIAGQN